LNSEAHQPGSDAPPATARRRAVLSANLARLLRTGGLTTVLVGAAAFFLYWVQRSTPIRHWLTWRYGMYWGLTLLLFAAATGVGNVLLRWLLRRYLRLDEHLVLSAALGILAFGLVWFLLGVAGLYSGWTFYVVPLAFLTVSARSLYSWIGRYLRRRALFGRARRERFPLVLRRALVALGTVSLALLYVAILTPDNVSYDARWYHAAAAEQYAVQGGIRPFADGWLVGAYPQLATWLYTWAFVMPGARLFDHVELAAHVEFVAFAFTLIGIPALVRRLLGGGSYSLSWVTRFLFPGVFLYDSSLALGADHIAAFWAIPIFLAFLRAYEQLELRRCVLAVACLAGAVLTKYSAVSLVAFPVAALTWRAVQLTYARRRTSEVYSALRSLSAMLGLGLLLTAPHWEKNWIWYHNPIYPLAYNLFSPRPWTVDTPDRFGHFMPPEWSAQRSWHGFLQSLEAMVNFSFVPHDWPNFHGAVPVFGSLFTLALPCLLFLKPRGRLWALFAASHIGVGVWFWMFHQDRYLQTLLPWMAAGTAAVGIATWRLGVAPRVALLALVVLQVAWGADTPFIPGHAMAGTPWKPALELFSSSYRHNYKDRFAAYEPLGKVKHHVAPGGTVMLHEMHMHLGIGVPTVSDWIGWQGGVSYVRTAAPTEMYGALRTMEVTDVLWTRSSRGYDSLGGDLAFYYFMTRHALPPEDVGGYLLSRLPEQAPTNVGFKNRALVLDCGETYASGVYSLSDLSVTVLPTARLKSDYPLPLVPLERDAELGRLLENVDAVAINRSCTPTTPNMNQAGFQQAAQRAGLELWVRARSKSSQN
jgi:hypothetical protein